MPTATTNFPIGSAVFFQDHLHTVLSLPDSQGYLLLVPVCSWDSTADPACRLGCGDHDFFIRDSFVDYHNAKRIRLEALRLWVRDGQAELRGSFSQSVLVRIRSGADATEHLAGELRMMLIPS